jgi:hypothetical protein
MALAALLLALLAAPAPQPAVTGKMLEPGMELLWLKVKTPIPAGDSRIAVLRIDPAHWQLELVAQSRTGDKAGKSAREWAHKHGLVAAINAGMYGTDYKTHVGYMESRGHVDTKKVNDYQSVAAFDPRAGSKEPPFRIFDLDEPGVTVPSIRASYGSLIQNLRLVKKPGSNRWGPQKKRWSEAALGEDERGRILFLFCRSPLSMYDLSQELLAAGLGLVALQHLEGGPEAQLFIDAGGERLELFGSYETSFREDDSNARPWPVPNVLGVRRRTTAP